MSRMGPVQRSPPTQRGGTYYRRPFRSSVRNRGGSAGERGACSEAGATPAAGRGGPSNHRTGNRNNDGAPPADPNRRVRVVEGGEPEPEHQAAHHRSTRNR